MLKGCFVDNVSESVKLTDTLPPTAQGRSPTRSCQFSRLEDLGEFFDNPENQTYDCRFMYVSGLTHLDAPNPSWTLR